MTGWIVDPSGNIEVEFESLKAINPVSSSQISRYTRVSDGMPGLSPGEGQPFEFICIADITDITLFDAIWRKMNYFEKQHIPVLLILPSEKKALEGYIENVSPPISADRANIATLTFKFQAGGFVMGYCYAAADLTITGTLVTDADANANQALKLDAQNENGTFTVVQSSWALPGLVVSGGTYQTYRLYARAKDSAQVASDLELYNKDTAAHKTLTASFKWYYSDRLSTVDDSGDTCSFIVKKDTATANNIYVDMVILVQQYIT